MLERARRKSVDFGGKLGPRLGRPRKSRDAKTAASRLARVGPEHERGPWRSRKKARAPRGARHYPLACDQKPARMMSLEPSQGASPIRPWLCCPPAAGAWPVQTQPFLPSERSDIVMV